MQKDPFGEITLSEDEIFYLLYSGKIKSLTEVNIADNDVISQYNNSIKENFDDLTILKSFSSYEGSIQEYDIQRQNQWFIPDNYKNFPIEQFLINLCKDQDEIARVELELDLFKKYNLINVIIYLKYLIDYFRENNIVWGIGRGSSVASYCLYLLGVHKINSIKYKLDIHEFIK